MGRGGKGKRGRRHWPECVEAVEACVKVGDEVVNHSGDYIHDCGFGMIMMNFWLWLIYLCGGVEELLCGDCGVENSVFRFAAYFTK